jgi:hypothetical protein
MLLFIWASPPHFLLGPAHARPRACPLPPCSHYHWGPPVRASAPLSEQRRGARAHRVRVTAGRDAVGTPPTGRSQAPRTPRHVAPPRPDPPVLPLFPSLPRRRPSRSNMTEPLVCSPVTNSSPTPLSSATSLPPIPTPGPLPPATRGLSLPRVTGRHASRAVTRGRLPAQCRGFNHFFNCFKF